MIFVMDKLVRWLVFQFYPTSIIAPMAHTLYLIHLQWQYLLLAIEVTE